MEADSIVEMDEVSNTARRTTAVGQTSAASIFVVNYMGNNPQRGEVWPLLRLP